MENKKFLSQSNEDGPNYGRAIRTEAERKHLGVYLENDSEDYFMERYSLIVMVVMAVAVLAWLLGLT